MPASFREEYLQLLKLVKNNSKNPDLKLVKKAFEFSKNSHKSQKRLSSEPFFTHPLKVALRLAELGLDSETVAAALLHDCLEDTDADSQILKREFGKEVLDLVEGVSKLRKIAEKKREEQQVQDLEKLLLASIKDLRVFVIKLADKINNLETIKHLPRERQEQIASEALKVYAPLAHKLSMHRMRFQIEDLAFKALQPERFAELETLVEVRKRRVEKSINALISKVRKECSKAGIPVVFLKETKALYSTEEKIVRFKKTFEEIQDFMLLDLLTNSVEDCYVLLGKLHSLFKPVPRKFKDFIAMPEYNLYQALHTTVIGPFGTPIKCYISTFEMHEIAEHGVIFFLKNKNQKNLNLLKEKTKWMQSLLKPKNLKNPKKFLAKLNSELEQTIIVFTPKGDKIELPLESTPIDFAYKIHTDLGEHCWKSIVNGKQVPVSTGLNAGDIVRIVPSKTLKSKPAWLSIVKSHGAREALERKFKKL